MAPPCFATSSLIKSLHLLNRLGSRPRWYGGMHFLDTHHHVQTENEEIARFEECDTIVLKEPGSRARGRAKLARAQISVV